MLEQWRDELEARFSLTFTILDRAHVTRMRRERGFAVNPWTTHSRFLISHRLLIDETYAAGLRDWLGEFAPRTLLVLDEAHHAAPSSGARYAIDSQTTRAVRDVAPRFEHRLFLSATPHNGHSNSFSALLEILDPQRFCRGVKVLKGQLDDVMVRRLKSDVRELEGGFPRRTVEQIDVKGLPPDAPELVLAEKLSAYREQREKRLAHARRSQQAAGALAVAGLQKRLLSSIEAFAKTLSVHRKGILRALEEARGAEEVPDATLADLEAITAGTDRDTTASEADDAAGLDGDPQHDGQEGQDGPDPEHELAERMETATLVSSGAPPCSTNWRWLTTWLPSRTRTGTLRTRASARSSTGSAATSVRNWRPPPPHPHGGTTGASSSSPSTRTRAATSNGVCAKRSPAPTGLANVSPYSPARPRGRRARRSNMPSTPSRTTIRSGF